MWSLTLHYSSEMSTVSRWLRPILAAVVFGGVPCAFVFLSLHVTLTSLRGRLTITDQAVRTRRCFRTREVDFDAVTRAVWKPGGSLMLYTSGCKVKTELGLFGLQERAEIIELLRHGLVGHLQKGREEFERRVVPGGAAWGRRRARLERHFVWVQNVLPALGVGCVHMCSHGFANLPETKFFFLLTFGLGGYLVVAYRWRHNEAEYDASFETESSDKALRE